MPHFKSITIIAFAFYSIAPNLCAEINGVSEIIRLGTPNCAINDLRNEEDRRAENVRTEILIENCTISSLPRAAFAQVNGVVLIEISGSDVDSIDTNAFEGLNELQRILLTNNNLTKFHLWSDHQDLNAVSTLDLHRNAFTELDANALRPYRNLKYLSLADNLITDIPMGFFGKISSIQTLHLDGNKIGRIEAEIFKPLLQLQDLHLENNEISFIDEFAFTTLAHLETLRLDNNRITSLDRALFFATPRLQQLNLSHNALSNLTMELQDNVELKVIDLSYNSLTALRSETIEGVQSLEIFNISHNLLRTIEPSALEDFVRVKQLDISHNKLKSLRDNQLTYLESIECLNFSHNSIESIQPFTFTDLRTLRSIDLSHNRLESDAFVQKIDALRTLDLSANLYRWISMTALEVIDEVKLVGNLWSCSWLVTELVNSTTNVRNDVHFGHDLTGIDAKAMGIRQPEEVICYDDRNVAHESNLLIQRHIVIVYPKGECSRDVEQEALAINDQSQAFSKLLSNEFDFKACLIWTAIAVIVVIGLVRLIKCCLDRSERRSERFRITQQEKVMKDIEDYFAQTNAQKE